MGSMTSQHHLARMALILTVLKMVCLDLLTLVVRNAQFFLGGKMEKRSGKFVNYVKQQQQQQQQKQQPEEKEQQQG